MTTPVDDVTTPKFRAYKAKASSLFHQTELLLQTSFCDFLKRVFRAPTSVGLKTLIIL
ncbi:hypothetical protein [Bartonella sp. DB5-6]|uniref:hypothetical protein n=1 Tax=Bartonella sp. DB5-6 TaxID=1094755 RepID=UPI0003189C3F|nr:hypothetical protein [Bartonella sp. DB5-6]